MTPELFVPSVPWRLPALLDVVAALGRQTTETRVHFVLDGHSAREEGAVRDAAARAELDYDVMRGPPGAGARWRIADALASAPNGQWTPEDSRYSVPLESVLILSLDDDLVPGRLYVQRTLEAWERLRDPFSWCGSALGAQNDYVRMTAEPLRDVRLGIAGAGGFCLPAKLLRGIASDPAASRFFGVLGHDEALVSWWLAAKHGARIWRPRGAADVREHPLAHDPRSQWLAGQGRCPPLVAELEARGWPVVDAPPVDPLARFRGRPLK